MQSGAVICAFGALDALGCQRRRIERLSALPLATLDVAAIRAALKDIGSEAGASGMVSA